MTKVKYYEVTIRFYVSGAPGLPTPSSRVFLDNFGVEAAAELVHKTLDEEQFNYRMAGQEITGIREVGMLENDFRNRWLEERAIDN